ncbi:MAG: hypothetical protein ACXWQO_06155 [Bdellovibrionota bacterium]
MAAKVLLSLLFLLSPLSALAGDECYRDFLVVDQTVVWDFSQPQRLDLPLPTYNPNYGMMPTDAAAHFGSMGQQRMNVVFDYDSAAMSLPYNIFRVDLMVGDADASDSFKASIDNTSDCTKTQPSVYPGKFLALQPIKILPHSNGAARGLETVHVKIWGKIR